MEGRASQRRRLALLVLLAASPGGQASRDRLIGLLWPESDTESARHLLASAVYELRRALGDQVLLSRGEDLVINPAELETDISRLDRALVAGDNGAVLAVFSGPFADGFFVSDAREFEGWLESARSRYQNLFLHTLEKEASACEARGDLVLASELWVRLLNLDPADGRIALRAMRVQEAAGLTAAAVRTGEFHASWLMRELGLEVERDVRTLLDQLTVASGSRTLPGPALPPRRKRISASVSSRGVVAGFLGGALVLVTVVLAGSTGEAHRAASPSVTGRVLVLPFSIPDTQHQSLQSHLGSLLRAGLDGTGDIEVIRTPASAAGLTRSPETDPEAARRLAAASNAASFIIGQVEEVSGSLRLRAWLYSIEHDDPLVQVTVSGDPVRVAETADRLLLAMLADWPRPPADRMAGIAARSTSSVPALKAWLSGEREYRAGHFLAASEAFARSTVLDSSFALAFYRLSQARLAADFPDTRVAGLDQHAAELSDALPERDQLLIRAYRQFRLGEAEGAEQRYQSLVNLYPDDVEAWTELGETRFHYNPVRGLPVAAAREAFERAVELDPDNWTALWHLAHLEALAGNKARFVRILDQLLAMNPESAQALDLRYLRALGMGNRSEEQRLATEISNVDELRLFQLMWRAAVYLRDFDGAERIAQKLAEPTRPPYPQLQGRLGLVYLNLARGRRERATEELRRATALQGVEGQLLTTRVWLTLLPGSGASPSILQDLLEAIPDPPAQARDPAVWSFYLGMRGLVYSALGDSSAALQLAGDIEAKGDRTAALILRADVARRAGRADAALQLLNQRSHTSWYGYYVGAPLSLLPYARYLQGQVLCDLGRHDEGGAWLGSLGEFGLADLAYLPAARCEASPLPAPPSS